MWDSAKELCFIMEFNGIGAFSRAFLFHNMGFCCIHLFLRHTDMLATDLVSS